MFLALLFNVGGSACDILSSRHFPPGFSETNPFSRDLLGGFVLKHALAYEGSWLVLLLVVAGIFYFGLRRFSEVVAQSAFAAWFLFYGIHSYAAAMHNWWIHIGWYVE
jgi:hypothetical protein